MRNPKLKYFGHHWTQLLWDVLKTTVAGFGVIITFSDALLNVLPDETFLHEMLDRFVHMPFQHPASLLIVIALLMIIGLLMNWPVTKAVYKDTNSDIRVIVECADLFEQDGLRVIHCVDTFDTALGTIISPRTVHGIFLSRCNKAGVDIDKIIDDKLRWSDYTLDDELPAKQKRFPLGTICPITIGEDDYCMVSFTHLNKEGSISITRKEYTDFLMTMWRNLADPLLKHDVVNVAVMGNRFVDLPAEFSTEQKIDLMLQTFFAVSKEKPCCRTLRICVHESNMAEVDFPHYKTIIEHLAKRPIL